MAYPKHPVIPEEYQVPFSRRFAYLLALCALALTLSACGHRSQSPGGTTRPPGTSSAWLPAGSLPMSQKYTWRWYTQLPAVSTGSIGYDGVGVTCAQPTLDRLGATDVAGQMAHAPQQGAQDWSVNQRLYFFPDERKARAAFSTLSTVVGGCVSQAAVTSPGIHRTADGDRTAAWVEYPVPTNTPTTARYESHSFLAQRGRVLSILAITTATDSGTPSADYRIADDRQVAAELATHLSAYATTHP